MKGYKIYRITVSLICSIFIIVTMFASTKLFYQPEVSKNEVESSAQEIIKQDIKFMAILAGSGETEIGTSFSFHRYESSDGIKLYTKSEDRGSSSGANRKLQKQIKKAEKIIEQGPELNERGQQIGERAVLLFPPDDPHQDRAAVLWTDGQDLNHITSSSLEHVLKFEKTLNKKKPF